MSRGQQAERAKREIAEDTLRRRENEIDHERRSYMLTLAAIAKANGGEVRIPDSAIEAISPDDEMVNFYDWETQTTVFRIRKSGADYPSGIILPGRGRG